MEAGYKFRPYRQLDIPLIQNSWSQSYYKGADFQKYLSPREFNSHHRPIREAILNKPSMAIIVAHAPDDEDLILGWVLVERPYKAKGLYLHYIYVKEAFKGLDIGLDLLEKAIPQSESPVMVTHMTDKARKILKKKQSDKAFKDFVYAPDTFMIRDNYLKLMPILGHLEPRGEL